MDEQRFNRAALRRRRFIYRLLNSAKARLVFQCAVCGGALAVLMGTSLFGGDVGEWVKTHTSKAITQNADWPGYGEAVINMIGGAKTPPAQDADEDTDESSLKTPENSRQTPATAAYDPRSDVRVDEAILSNLQKATDPYLDQSNPGN